MKLQHLDGWIWTAAGTVYVAFVLVMIWHYLPGPRARLLALLAQQRYLYQQGSYQQRWQELPAWRREALEVRGKAPWKRYSGPGGPLPGWVR